MPPYICSMIGHPTSKTDLEKEIKLQQSIYKAVANLPDTAKTTLEYIETLKAKLKQLEQKETTA